LSCLVSEIALSCMDIFPRSSRIRVLSQERHEQDNKEARRTDE
jgi:hypothetical protein